MNNNIDTDQLRGNMLTGILRHKATVSTVALVTALAVVSPAWATIQNTVTATGSSPGNTDDITSDASEEVDVVDDITTLGFVKTVTLADGVTPVPANAPVGTQVQYQFAVTNTGNVTMSNVNITELSFDGDGSVDPTDATVTNDAIDTSTAARTTETTNDSTDGAAGDGVWDTLAPGDTITFTSLYTVTQNDITDNGNGDGTLDNNAEAVADAPASTGVGTVTSANDDASFDLEDQDPSLQIAKYATSVLDTAGTPTALVDVTDPLAPINTTAPDSANVAAGDVITYTYVVTNDGNVPISAVSLSDTIDQGTAANAPTPGNEALLATNTGGSTDATVDGEIDLLQPGDSATFTGTYLVTQDDVDTLQ